jgi:hypothetical protein
VPRHGYGCHIKHHIKPESLHRCGTLIVITSDEDFSAIEFRYHLCEAVALGKSHVAQEVAGVTLMDATVEIIDNYAVHVVYVLEGTIVVGDTVRMPEVPV